MIMTELETAEDVVSIIRKNIKEDYIYLGKDRTPSLIINNINIEYDKCELIEDSDMMIIQLSKKEEKVCDIITIEGYTTWTYIKRDKRFNHLYIKVSIDWDGYKLNRG